jgi:hypothetical protein
MNFQKNSEMVQLADVPKPSPEEANLHQLHRLVDTNAIDTCVRLYLTSDDTPPTLHLLHLTLGLQVYLLNSTLSSITQPTYPHNGQ